ncbi:hypothetical protein X975_07729, partial [Stegodyphus mimosarum]
MRRLSLDKQKCDSSENTTFRHSVIHIAPVWHHSKRFCLCCGVNGSLLNGCRECRPRSNNQQEMVLVDTGTSRVSCTCCRIAVQVTCRTTTACRQMRRTTRAGVTLAAPAPLVLPTFPCSNHVCHSRCTVLASMWVSAAI